MSYLKNQLTLPLTDPLFRKHTLELIKLIRGHEINNQGDADELVEKVESILHKYRDQLQQDVGEQILEKEVMYQSIFDLAHLLSISDDNQYGNYKLDVGYYGADDYVPSPNTNLLDVLNRIKYTLINTLRNVRTYRSQLRQAVFTEQVKEIINLRAELNELYRSYDHLKKTIYHIEHRIKIQTLEDLSMSAYLAFKNNNGLLSFFDDAVAKARSNSKEYEKTNRNEITKQELSSQLKHLEYVLRYCHGIEL